jgi:hypothetical protein
MADIGWDSGSFWSVNPIRFTSAVEGPLIFRQELIRVVRVGEKEGSQMQCCTALRLYQRSLSRNFGIRGGKYVFSPRSLKASSTLPAISSAPTNGWVRYQDKT